MRWVLAIALALFAGIASLYSLTNGFTVLTAEAARRQAVAIDPRPVPDTLVLTEKDDVQSLINNLKDDGRVAIVNFFYTRCMSLCLAQGSLTQQIQEVLDDENLADKIRLISISFDIRDKAKNLQRYADLMQADSNIWQFMTFTQPESRDELLDLFGITVIPAPLGEFEHNAAFHIVTPDGKLRQIYDLDEPGLAFSSAKQLAGVQ